MDYYFGYTGIMGIVVSIVCIVLAWWALQGINFSAISKSPKNSRFITLQIILAIIIGYELAQFFMDYLSWSLNLKSLF